VRRHGALGIFLTRFLPGVRAAVLPFAGAFGLSPARALLPAAVASAIWYAFLVAAGSMLGNNWAVVKTFVGDANRVLGLCAAAVVVAFGLWWWRRRRSAR
jgi:membrane protein DedA with SNARE-associated domain